MNIVIKGFIIVAGLVFLGLNIWAFAQTPPHDPGDILRLPMEALSRIIPAHRWATVITADLVLGWCLSSLLIVFTERNWFSALVWIVMLFWIGNFVLAIYWLFRLEHIRRRLGDSQIDLTV